MLLATALAVRLVGRGLRKEEAREVEPADAEVARLRQELAAAKKAAAAAAARALPLAAPRVDAGTCTEEPQQPVMEQLAALQKELEQACGERDAALAKLEALAAPDSRGSTSEEEEESSDGSTNGDALPGVMIDGFGVWPRPMRGGNNNYMQWRRHCRQVSAMLFRLLHRNTSETRVAVDTLAPLEGMLWLAVKSYCVEMLVQEELAAQRKGGSILQSPEDLERLQAAKRLYEAAKNSKELREAVNTPLRGAAARLASLMQCMKDCKRRAEQFKIESDKMNVAKKQLAQQQADAASSLPTPRRRELERDLQAQLAAQEREVSALRSTASAIAMTMRGPEAVLRSRKEERDQLQQRLRQLLSDGQSEEAAAVQAQIEELSEQIVRRLAELDALHADRCEADKRANDAETKAAQMRRALASLTPEGTAAGRSGSAAEDVRTVLELQLHQAQIRLRAVQLETQRRLGSVARMRQEVESMRAEFNRQQEQAMLQAAQQPIPASFLEGVQANRAAMDAVHQLWQADDIIRTALVALEGELQQEQAALQASTQEQQSLVAQVEGLQARLAEAPQ